jgi:hypothetical protein
VGALQRSFDASEASYERVYLSYVGGPDLLRVLFAHGLRCSNFSYACVTFWAYMLALFFGHPVPPRFCPPSVPPRARAW